MHWFGVVDTNRYHWYGQRIIICFYTHIMHKLFRIRIELVHRQSYRTLLEYFSSHSSITLYCLGLTFVLIQFDNSFRWSQLSSSFIVAEMHLCFSSQLLRMPYDSLNKSTIITNKLSTKSTEFCIPQSSVQCIHC